MTRRDRRRARREAANHVQTPEGIPIRLDIARVGARLSAQILDLLITGFAAFALLILLAQMEILLSGPGSSVAILMFFAMRVPYYTLSELAWNGQTLGKRALRIKVVAHDGGPLTPHALVLRNLMKEAEVFFPMSLLFMAPFMEGWMSLLAWGWCLLNLAVPLLDSHARRLGDMMAGTHVVHLPQPVLLADIAARKPLAPRRGQVFGFRSDQLDHYGAFELQTLETFLRAGGVTGAASDERARTRAKIVANIRTRIGHADPVPRDREDQFLRDFYAAQRKHLEQRQLFGDRRADKHHNANPS